MPRENMREPRWYFGGLPAPRKAVGGPGLSFCQNEVGRHPMSPFPGSVKARSKAAQSGSDIPSIYRVEHVATV
jgi:hypothetical protein